jgi:hypothetical protein
MPDDVGYGIAVDTSGSAYVAGITPSDNFPTAQRHAVELRRQQPMFGRYEARTLPGLR